MEQSSEIMNLVKQNNGVVTTAMVVAAGLSRGSLKYLADKGELEKASRGVYVLPEIWEDDLLNIQTRFKKGVFSLGTALFLCDLTDRTPNHCHMTFPEGYNLSGPKAAGIRCNTAKKDFYSIGIEDVKSPGGNIVQAYNAERTLCDILRTQNNTDVQLVSEAFKRYAGRKEKDIPLLSQYAHQFKVEKRLRAYLEVLL